VAAIIVQEALHESLPRTAAFAKASRNELQRAEAALDEIDGEMKQRAVASGIFSD
jgi:hypothetical protein